MQGDEEDRTLAAVTEVMARLAAGDMAAMTTLQDRWGVAIKAALRRIGRGRNVHLQPDDLDELLVDAVLVLQEVAGSWSPEGGAMPWVWAGRRLANVVDRFLGQLGTSIDAGPDLHLAAEPMPTVAIEEVDVEEVLTRLAREGSIAGERSRQIADLQVALRSVASERDRRVFLELAVQAASGDPSPANTVGEMFDLQPSTVRQIRCRVRRRLQSYSGGPDHPDGSHDGLTGLPLVA
jgi:hypothetical protein